MIKLEIPEAAVRTAWEAHRDGLVAVQDMLAAAAPAVVAAELRRLADAADAVTTAGVHVGFQMLRSRAEELDGGA